MKILIVEDDQTKLQHIISTVLSLEGISFEDITSVRSSHEAKSVLVKTNFDVMILDIAIPPRLDLTVESDEGSRLLDELSNRPIFNLPTHVIGLTSYDDIYAESEPKFRQQLRFLIHYDPTSDLWSESLLSGLAPIISSTKSIAPGTDSYSSKLAVICALDSPELSSVLDIPWNWEEELAPGDPTRVFRGSFTTKNGSETVWAASASRKGMPAAAILSSKLIARFRPEYIAMVGITAGVPGKTNFGDIVIAESSWDWGSGKWTISDEEALVFQPDPYYLTLDFELQNKLLKLRDGSEQIREIQNGWKGDKPDTVLKLRLGPMASGAAVLADGSSVQEILRQNRSLLAVEMESFAVFAAANEAPNPKPKAFVMKSVVDFGDPNKDDRFQRYAAYTSAQALRVFVERILFN